MPHRSKSTSTVLVASPAVQVVRRWSRGFKGNFVAHGVGEWSALEQGMEKLEPSVLLLDLALPNLGRIRSVRTLRRLSPATKIIVFTSAPNEREGISALMAGAKGYCHKNIKPVLLKKAVELVQRGEIWAGRKLIPRLIEELTSLTERRQRGSPTRVKGRLDGLTSRERDIANLIGSGARNKEIASQIHISERTVKAHLTAIFRKVGVSDRLRLGLFVNEHNRLAGKVSVVDKGLVRLSSN